jgi:FkbM family methyltransferase
MLALLAAVPCSCTAPRNVYLDAGANWGNTLELFRKIPRVFSAPLPSPWHVFAFEAMPRIAPYADKCAVALSAGLPLPFLPIPPSGSTADLLHYAPQYNCTRKDILNASSYDLFRGRRLFLRCMLDKLGPALSSLQENAQLCSPAAVRDRLELASSRCQTDRDVFTLVPAAVGVDNSTLTFTQSDAALLIGGGSPWGFPVTKHSVQQVDFAAWFKQSFTSRDHVVLKLDVEGAEHRILKQMILDGSIHHVDLLLWECHPFNSRACADLKVDLSHLGVLSLLDPYKFPAARARAPSPFHDTAEITTSNATKEAKDEWAWQRNKRSKG